MKKFRFIILSIVLLGLVFNDALAIPLDYKLVYQVYRIENGVTKPVFLNSIIYCQGSIKSRIETESIDLQSENKLTPMVSIIRIDKNLMWTLDLNNKIYIKRFKLSDIPGMAPSNFENIFQKIGEDKILNDECSIYTNKDQANLKYWISNDNKLVLKMETGTENLIIVTEAKELKFEKQDDSLFEIPSDFDERK